MDTVYIQPNQLTKLTNPDIFLADIATVVCSEPHILARCKALKVMSAEKGCPKRMIVSMAEIIEQIQEKLPDVKVEILGEVNIVIEYLPNADTPLWWEWTKTALISVIVFCGAAFAIMTFDSDVNVQDVFGVIYEMILGNSGEGVYWLEWSYSIGLGLGIFVFYNHFSRKKSNSDPTPLEVEMRTYETNILTTEIQNHARQQKKCDRKK